MKNTKELEEIFEHANRLFLKNNIVLFETKVSERTLWIDYTVLQSIITPRGSMCDCIRWQVGKWKNIFCKANDAADKCDESNE